MEERKLNALFKTHLICVKENEYQWDIHFSPEKKMINQSALF